ncbi:putative rRNA-processing protein UTP23-like protein [Hypsibius exemplaris]|uniref:rRNA-processing protein UTP23 homolog n=1 Tax=Hypsibius exemplaris TaxID=2072580 RepID=A0A1W0WLF3_HYPEX|nr:putative rRNA-processing protein UTP23-like protein [Hypsibius exemplaris]
MKGDRRKKARNVLKFYTSKLQFTRTPLQILVDGTFACQALAVKVNIKEQVPNYLGSECSIVTTGCCVHELEKLGPDLHGAVCILRQFNLVSCGHAEKPLAASECIQRITRGGNTEEYFVATKDREMQDRLRKRPRVPLLYLHNKALTLEKPSEKSLQAANTLEQQKLLPAGHQKAALDEMKKREFGEKPAADALRKRKRHGPKMPNSLSCKKAKRLTRPATKDVETPLTSKRRHKRVKMSDALKSVYQKLISQAGGPVES